jgi:Uma2 family endonuclease
MPNSYREPATGPFRVEHLREGDRYELSNGHAIYCAPSGRDHAAPNLTGAAVIDSDPAVDWAGVDAGFAPSPTLLRAPDVAVAAPAAAGEDAGGWIPGAPPLAVEYAGRGQDEADLKIKIAELLAAGTRFVWVVRLRGPRRVEVHEAGQPVRRLVAGELLEAPGILRNPVPVEALYDRAAGHRATLRNLLQREGYDSLEAVRAEGRDVGHQEGRHEGQRETRIEDLQRLLTRRFGELPAWANARLEGATTEQLSGWVDELLDAQSLETLLGTVVE